MDLLLDEDAFLQASIEMKAKSEELGELRSNIERTLYQLKKDWISDASQEFFRRVEEDLLKNLDKYSIVFGYISQNLTTASQKYEEVFRAVETVAEAQY